MSLPDSFYPDDRVIWSPKDGVTYSMLTRWMMCPERARLAIYYGLRDPGPISAAIAFGDVLDIFVEHWHASFDASAAIAHATRKAHEYVNDKVLSLDDIAKIEATIKAYVRIYEDHDKHLRRQEFNQAEFYVRVPLPSGRDIYLRGKIDELFTQLSTYEDEPDSLVLCDLKTKGDYTEDQFQTGLTYDLQLNIYLLILETLGHQVTRLQYDVIRRIGASGCQFQPRRKTGRGKAKVGAESHEEFSDKIYECLINNHDYFFNRINKPVCRESIDNYRKVCLYPLLERFVDWTTWLSLNWDDPFRSNGKMIIRLRRESIPDEEMKWRDVEANLPNSYHFMRPTGVYDAIANGWTGDLTGYLLKGDRHNLQVKKNYSELHNLDAPHLTNVEKNTPKNKTRKTRKTLSA